MSLVDDDIHKCATCHLLMQSRDREVHVAWNHRARPDQRLADQVFGAASLVGRHQMTVAVKAAYGLLKYET